MKNKKQIETEAEKLAKRDYTVTVHQEQLSDGSVYIAETIEFPNLFGCGKTEQDAVADLCAGRVDYIAYLLKHRLPVPEPKGETK